MAKDKIKEFKNLLRTYRYWQDKVRELDFEIKLCYDSLGASIRSVDNTRIRTATPPNKEMEYRTRDKIERLLERKKTALDVTEYINNVLTFCENRKAIERVYCDFKSMERVAMEMGYPKTTLQNIMNREIKKALEQF